MKEYIKKFESAVAAHGYDITYIPFMTSVNEIPIQNLVCNKTGKWLENDNGIVIICPPDYEIHYTATNQVTPYKTDVFGANYLADESKFDSETKKGVLVFDENVTKIGKHAFYRCTGLTSITIPDSVTNIEQYAFSNCSGLTSMTIPNSVTSIGVGAFVACTGLTSIKIPNKVTSIEFGTFQDCNSLTSVTIPNSVTSIGSYAFDYCNSLSSVNIPDSVTSIRSWAFHGCTGLTSITIPNRVTSIESNAFSDCSGLTSVTIGNSVTSIGDSAFYGCTGLTAITCEATTPPTIQSSTWNNVTKSIPVYVPADSVSLYQQAQYWNEFINIQAII